MGGRNARPDASNGTSPLGGCPGQSIGRLQAPKRWQCRATRSSAISAVVKVAGTPPLKAWRRRHASELGAAIPFHEADNIISSAHGSQTIDSAGSRTSDRVSAPSRGMGHNLTNAGFFAFSQLRLVPLQYRLPTRFDIPSRPISQALANTSAPSATRASLVAEAGDFL
jgi:hypothetical protein